MDKAAGASHSSTVVETYDIGDKVEAKPHGAERWRGARVSEWNADGTYEIEYDDGGAASGVDGERMRYGWEDQLDFCAYDTPMPGTARFKVHYMTQGLDRHEPVPEQFRIYDKDHSGEWEDKFHFFAYPAGNVVFSP